MVIVAGVIDVEPGERDRFLHAKAAQQAAARAEAGCLEYAFSADLAEPGRVRLFEIWESAEHLAAHAAGMAGTTPDDGGVVRRSTALVRYEVASSASLG